MQTYLPREQLILWCLLLCISIWISSLCLSKLFGCSRSHHSCQRCISAVNGSVSVCPRVLAFYVDPFPQPSAAGLKLMILMVLEVWVAGRKICPPQMFLALLHSKLVGSISPSRAWSGGSFFVILDHKFLWMWIELVQI